MVDAGERVARSLQSRWIEEEQKKVGHAQHGLLFFVFLCVLCELCGELKILSATMLGPPGATGSASANEEKSVR